MNEGSETTKTSILLTDFKWFIRTDLFDDLLMSGQMIVEGLSSGLEATVYKIKPKTFEEDFVLKLWDKRPPGDVWNQYYLLELTEEHSDISHLIQEILSGITISSDCMIHGDFNLGNVVASQGKYTIIDWTNVQLGERRYDFAWASFLILIYSGDECYREFIDVYNELLPIDSAELYIFEIIACLRWIWLSRIAPVPIFNNTKSRVKEFIHNHKELQEVAFVD